MALSIGLGAEGILVNGVNIGFVETPQWQNFHDKRAPELPGGEFFGQLAKPKVPLGRFGRSDEVTGLVAFLDSERASYIAGASIDVGGGMGGSFRRANPHTTAPHHPATRRTAVEPDEQGSA